MTEVPWITAYNNKVPDTNRLQRPTHEVSASQMSKAENDIQEKWSQEPTRDSCRNSPSAGQVSRAELVFWSLIHALD